MSNDYTFIPSPETDSSLPKRSRFPVFPQILILGGFLILVFGIGIVTQQVNRSAPSSNPISQQTAAINEAPDGLPDVIGPLQNIAITAESAFVLDVNTQRVLYSKNPDAVRPIASITKLMTTLVAHELVTEDTWVRIPQTASALESTSGLIPGQLLTQQSLRDFAMMSSSNDAAHSIATAVGALLDSRQPLPSFVAAMNIRAAELGLSSMTFSNTTGLDTSETQAGASASARDVSFLMHYILQNYPEILEPTRLADARIYTDTGAHYEAENTNQQLASIPQLLGSKTGYTTLAGGNLTIAFDAGYNRPVIITVLGSSYTGRFADAAVLIEAIQTSITNETQ